MLNLLIKYAKKLLTLLIVAALFTTTGYCYEQKDQYIKYSIEETIEVVNNRACEVIIRVGEYNNKPGKRIYLNEVDIRFKDIPTDIKIHSDSEGMMSGVVETTTFKGVHYEMIVNVSGVKWMIHSTKSVEPESMIGMEIRPEDIHIMKKSEYSTQKETFDSDGGENNAEQD